MKLSATTVFLAGAALASTAQAAAPKSFVLKASTTDKRFNGLCAYPLEDADPSEGVVLFSDRCGSNAHNWTFTDQILRWDGNPLIANAQKNGIAALDPFWLDTNVVAGKPYGKWTYDAHNGFLKAGVEDGFLVCIWNRDFVPQLFVYERGGRTGTPPSNCANIKLLEG